MDRKLLDVFSNLSLALQELSDALESNKKSKEATGSDIAESFKGLNIGEQLKSINDGIKKIQADNKEILKNQNKTISNISNQKSRESDDKFKTISDTKQQKNIKDGVKMIVLIAVGVLAIGMAFKLIGNVDIGSVIAISLALPLIAFAFEKISKVKIGIKETIVSSMCLVIMAGAITMASWILQYTKPVGYIQLITVVFIASAFAILSYSISKLAKGIEGVDAKNLWKLPLVLVAASIAITASSWILQNVKPVGFAQLVTTILIAGAFSVLSFGLGKLVNSMKGVNLLGVALLPLVLIGVSAAIMFSSQLLSKVVPITLAQAITTIFIAATFTILSYGIPRLADAVKNVGLASAAIMPIVLIALAGAVLGSSYLFSQVQIISIPTLINIALQAVTLTIISIVLGAAIWALDKLNVNPKSAAMAGISLIIIAATIMTSSLLLSMGNYGNYPSLSWTLNVAASMLAFGIGVVVLGTIISLTGGAGLAALALGGLGMLIIAGTIVGTAAILNSGNFTNYPGLDWSLGVGLSLTAFGISMVGLGAIIGLSLGLGYLMLEAGASGIKLVASTIVETADILSTGRFSGGPSISWAIGTGLLLTTFGASIMTLGAFIGSTLGLGYLALLAGAKGIKVISQSIVDAAFILSNGTYKGGPSKEWAEGVGLAISAFSPVYKNLSSGGLLSLFTGSGPSSEEMSSAIITISNGIVTAAQFFNQNAASFKNPPPVEWAEGVGLAISAFSPVYKNLSSGGLFSLFTGSGPSPEDMSSAILTISRGIIDAGQLFNDNKSAFGGVYPSVQWAEGVGASIAAFSPVIKYASDVSGITSNVDSDWLYKNVTFFAKAMSETSHILSDGNYKIIPSEYMSNLSSNIVQYMKLLDYLKGKDVEESKLFGLITISRASEISRMADDYDKLAKSIKNLSASIQSIDVDRITALKTLTGSIVLMSLMDSDQFNSMMDALEDKAKIFVDVINDMENGVSSREIKISSPSSSQSGATMQDVINVMSRIDAKMGQLVTYSSSISLKINEIRSNKNGIKSTK